jgi:hypothetical protein
VTGRSSFRGGAAGRRGGSASGSQQRLKYPGRILPKTTLEVPHLGPVTSDELGWLRSIPIRIPMLGRTKRTIVLGGYESDRKKGEFHAAIKNFLAGDRTVLERASKHVYRYYLDVREDVGPDEEGFPRIRSAATVWKRVRFGPEPMVRRRHYGDKKVYVSLECNCDWDAEHGLQLVFKNGRSINKVGPYDGHLTNSDAYAKRALERVVYVAH